LQRIDLGKAGSRMADRSGPGALVDIGDSKAVSNEDRVELPALERPGEVQLVIEVIEAIGAVRWQPP
jgi:hypothetical protein